MTSIISARITVDNNSVSGDNTITYTNVGSHYIYNKQAVGTSYELLTLGDCSSVKYLYLENDTTASMQVAYDNAGAKVFATLSGNNSGSNFCLLPPSSSNASGIYVKASSVADLIVIAYEV